MATPPAQYRAQKYPARVIQAKIFINPRQMKLMETYAQGGLSPDAVKRLERQWAGNPGRVRVSARPSEATRLKLHQAWRVLIDAAPDTRTNVLSLMQSLMSSTPQSASTRRPATPVGRRAVSPTPVGRRTVSPVDGTPNRRNLAILAVGRRVVG